MNSFEELNLPSTLAGALKKIKFEKPTPVQARAIPVLLRGQDLMACAQTGSGKTGAYLIPMVNELLENSKRRGLVLAPTRELAQQISDALKSLVSKEKNFPLAQLVGGQDIRKQFKALQRKPRIIVATPGRLIDHLKRNTVQIHNVSHLVLDEGDRMIDMGFAPQLDQILEHLPKQRQTSFFTATMDKKVKALAKRYLADPVTLALDHSKPVAKIKQTVIQVEVKDKSACVLDELNERRGSVIVFLKTKHGTNRLKKYLADYGVSVGLIHGGRTQGQRNQAISAFRSGKTRVLCATDVAARGLDVPHVEHVINFDLPMQDEDYVHRVGRTARNGAEGEAISLVTPLESRTWNRLAKKYQIPDAIIPVEIEIPQKPKKKLERKKKSKKRQQKSATQRSKPQGARQERNAGKKAAKKQGKPKKSRRFSK